ncbi:hypothetical protein ACIBCO_37370 [Streptomyces violascens]|uniref:hypothetical protein n=1 Tax=Streptomyces violascens TaxID=67381 RepID=UPI00378B6DE3
MTADSTDLPKFVTFDQAAALLQHLGIDPTATAQSVRYLARARGERWPFGSGNGQVPYKKIANARTMDTKKLIEYLRAEPPNPHGRGQDKKPRRTGSAP